MLVIDDDTIEAIVAGDAVDTRFDDIVAFARQVRSLAAGRPPRPSPALQAVLTGRARHRRCRSEPRAGARGARARGRRRR
jgi:hypothetical protein